jgi:uracil-DNA glycosylase family 4
MAPEQQLRAYVDYLRDMGIYDLYHRADPATILPDSLREKLNAAPVTEPIAPAARTIAPPSSAQRSAPEIRSAPVPRPATSSVQPLVPSFADLTPSMPKPPSFDDLAPPPLQVIPAAERAAALDALRKEIGDCTRCPLAYAGRHTIVFADGDPNARLMFVGEGPGADEDASGLPFVGRAGQLLNNMIAAMGLKREEVYIANVVKCRPPANRQPEFVEATTCAQFLLKQIDIVHPEIIVALGATAATYLLGVKQSLASLRGRWHSARGAKVAVTYHPAFLLRDPRQKGEAWKDLQRVMAEMGLAPPKRPA